MNSKIDNIIIKYCDYVEKLISRQENNEINAGYEVADNVNALAALISARALNQETLFNCTTRNCDDFIKENGKNIEGKCGVSML